MGTRRARRTIRLLMALFSLSFAATTISDARAFAPWPVLQSWQTKQKARNAYAAGKKKLAAGDYAGALAEFRTAESLVPGAAPKYHIALCLDKMGKLEEAVAAYRTFIDDKPGPKYNDEVVAAGKRLAELQAQIGGKVMLRIEPAGAAGVRIRVDGSPVEGPELSLKPGKHVLVVSAEGYQESTQTVDVKGGETTEVSVTLTPIAAPPPPPSPDPLPDPEPVDEDDGQGLKIGGFVMIGVAVAAGAVTAAFGVTALSAKNDFDTTPTEELADDAENNALIADIFLGVTGAAALTGVILLAVGYSQGGDDEEEASAAPDIVPLAGPEGAGAAATWRF